jgi:shikimate kinase
VGGIELIMDTIFLTGFMGAGKTTVGQQLGQRLRLTVFDTDEMIESKLQKKAKSIFAEKGEEAFRDYEKEVLKKVTWENVIITTGGGIVTKQENRDWMKQKGTVFYLHCEPQELLRRLEGDQERPLLQEKEADDVLSLLNDRLPFYLEADYKIDTSGKAVEEIVEEIVKYVVNDKKTWV